MDSPAGIILNLFRAGCCGVAVENGDMYRLYPKQQMMPGWNNPASVQSIHLWLEGLALLCFGALVVFDVLAHIKKIHEHTLEGIGLSCFALAVLMEIAAYPYGQRNDELSNLKIAQLGQQAADAEHAARGFESQIAGFDARAREAEAQAEQARSMAEAERLERVRLESVVAPRTLSVEQQRSIIAALKRYSGHPRISVSSYGLDGEGAAIGQQLISVFSSAGIPVADGRANSLVSGGFNVGIHILGPTSEQQFISDVGKALSEIGRLQVVLNVSVQSGGIFGPASIGGAASFSGGRSDQVTGPTAPGTTVRVEVGIKPLPVLVAK